MSTDNEKACMYVGRLMQDFAGLESVIDEIFAKLFNISVSAYLLFLLKSNFSWKIELIEKAFKKQSVDHREKLRRLRKHSTLRNMAAHSSFEFNSKGIYFDWGTKIDGVEQDALGGGYVTFEHFDRLHEEADRIFAELQAIHASCRPLDDISFSPAYELREILNEEMIDASDNVVRFSRPGPNDD